MSTMLPEPPRTVVTGVRNGKSVFISDGAAPNAHVYRSIPGFMTSLCWATAPVPQLGNEAAPAAGTPVPPPAGETRLMVVCFPPDAVFAAPGFDGQAAAREQALHLPGLAELFEADNPGMHRTESLDYDIVLDGEIWLELDDGAEVHLKRGDVVVQRGTRHAWRNKGTAPATMVFVLVGASGSGHHAPL